MSDDKLLEATNRAARAAEIVDSDLFQEAVATIERDLIAAWKQTGLRDTEGRERAWQGVVIVGKMEDFFRLAISDGKIAKSKIDELTREKPKWEAVK